MITALLFTLVALFLKLLSTTLGILSFAIPDDILSASNYFLSYLSYVGFIFPINTLLNAFATVIGFWILLKLYHLTLWIISFVPFFGSQKKPDTIK